ncbi:glycosyltransferase [Pseudarthrobacter sp. C4D7]|uniref:glycosyltransferase n=1 Tax=Pseudarthrobacter sp. C4D7 TaxID=2735268 RepID=UPI0015850A77|nr:glycosyltransferase [Pseudarthrobacter sp. C4D7]NUT70599.1 hypothetical protein [Pseudarthrobacter sp. C4D7]
MSRSIDHVLLTRFNLPSLGTESYVRAQDGWLSRRLDLFEEFCLPSVRDQTRQDFHWIIYLDPESPDWLLDRLNDLNSPRIFTPVFRTAVSAADRVQDLEAVTGAAGKTLITTNLDNDDGLAADFVERLQNLPNSHSRSAVYFTQGLIRHGERVYARKDAANAFCSVRESWDDPQTCWADWHNRLGLSMSVAEIGGPAAWLQVIHGTNVSNRVRGRRIAVGTEHILRFGSLLAGVENPSKAALLREASAGLYRGARDAARSATRDTIILLAGKDGLDRVKTLVRAQANALVSRK